MLGVAAPQKVLSQVEKKLEISTKSNQIMICQEKSFQGREIAIRVTRLGEISPFGQFFMALGKFFSRKNSPMIWAKF